MKFVLSRVSGAKNSFYMANVFSAPWSEKYPKLSIQEKQKLAKSLCNSNGERSTDGLIFIHPKAGFDFAWDFFNSDGSNAEMCGNAARCATLFFHRKVKAVPEMDFETGAGAIHGQVVSSSQVCVEMTQISEIQKKNVLGVNGILVNTGVPHFVIEVPPDAALARQLRKVNDFGPSGANITFVQNAKDSEIEAVTFERGVEDYTEACGTGAVAAAIYLQEKTKKSTAVNVKMPGGLLRIEGAKSGARPYLTGEALIEKDLEIEL